MDIAVKAAGRSTCDRAHVGCVIVRDNRQLSTGYNGSISGLDHCDDAGHLVVNGACIRTIHAEENAIVNAAKLGISLDGSTAYITHFPCWRCFRSLVQVGIKRIVYLNFKLDAAMDAVKSIYMEVADTRVEVVNSKGENLRDTLDALS